MHVLANLTHFFFHSGDGRTQVRPLVHQGTTLLKTITALVSSLHLVPDHVSKCGLNHFPRKNRFLAGPSAKR
jgi:hypothetical protein